MAERTRASQFRSEMKWYRPDAHVRPVPDARNTQKKPYDSYVLDRGDFHAIEFKEVKALSVNPNIVKPHQVSGLREVNKSGGVGWVFIFLTKFKSTGLIFTINEWIDLFEYDYDGVFWKPTRGSIKIKELLEEFGVYRERMSSCGETKTIWNFDTICL